MEETLKSIHYAPKKFAEFPDNTSAIKACIEPLRRVRGAVEMVSIYGATLLAMELEYLVQAIIENRVTRNEDAAEVLATGMLQLPDYLENLYNGQPDIPLILLPILNDLRAVQDKHLLTESEFFAPDLNVAAPPQPYENCQIKGDVETIAKKLRPGYLSGLLGVIRQENVTESIEKLILVIDNMLIVSISEKARQLWWITSGIVDSLYGRGLDTSVALKILLGRVDQEIQRVIVHGEVAIDNNPPDHIIRSLLYYLAQSRTTSKRIAELKNAFKLNDIDGRTIEQARKNLHGFDANLVERFSVQIQEITTDIKNVLDNAIKNEEDITSLQPILGQLDTIADALGMLGINPSKLQVVKHRELLEQKIQQNLALDEEDMMAMASTLLQIESSLTDFGSSLTNHSSNNLSRTENLQLLRIVAQEIVSNIQTIKDHIGGFSSCRTNSTILTHIPEKLTHIAGLMRMLLHDQQANLTLAINAYIKRELVVAKPQVTNASMDLLANAIVGLENFYLTILEESVAPEIGLVVANHSMRQLGYAPDDYNPA